MIETVVIKNVTGVSQSIVLEGRAITLGPRASMSVVPKVAEKFLTARGPMVIKDEKINDTSWNVPMQDMTWLANLTGNPDAPSLVPTKVLKDKAWVAAQVENPLKEARPVSETLRGGYKEFTGPDGVLDSITPAAQTFTVPPFSRRQFPKHIAATMLERDAIREKNNRGLLVESRPPAEFEPDAAWKLNDIRAYLRLADADAPLGPSEEDVLRGARKKKLSQQMIEADIEQAKRDVLKRMFFRLVDSQYSLPTREEFEEFKTGVAQTAEVPTADEISQILAQDQLPEIAPQL